MSTAWNIVLVDDDEDFCEMLKAQIELDGEFEVAVAPNAGRGGRFGSRRIIRMERGRQRWTLIPKPVWL